MESGELSSFFFKHQLGNKLRRQMLALYLRICEKHSETKCVSGQLQGVAMLRRALAATNNSCVTQIWFEASEERKLREKIDSGSHGWLVAPAHIK